MPKIQSEDQLIDILTKVVSNRVFLKFLDKLGMCDIYAPTWGGGSGGEGEGGSWNMWSLVVKIYLFYSFFPNFRILHLTIRNCDVVMEGFDLYNSRFLCHILGNVNSLYIICTYSNVEIWMKKNLIHFLLEFVSRVEEKERTERCVTGHVHNINTCFHLNTRVPYYASIHYLQKIYPF